MKMEINWWETSKVILNDPEFITVRLKKYDRENISEKSIKEFGEFLKSEEGVKSFNLEAAQNASAACVCMFKWSSAIYSFYFVNKKVVPKKKQLLESEEKAGGL